MVLNTFVDLSPPEPFFFLPAPSSSCQGTFSEHSVKIQGTFSEHSVKIQGTFSEHSVNIGNVDTFVDLSPPELLLLARPLQQLSATNHTQPAGNQIGIFSACGILLVT
jgi:hypothetical protein